MAGPTVGGPSPFVSSSNPISSYILDAQDTLDLLRDEAENLDFQFLDFSGAEDKSKAVSVKIDCLDAPGVIKMASDVAECLLEEPWSCVAATVSATMLLRTVLDAASLRDTDALALEMQPLLWSSERIRIGAESMLNTFRDFERERVSEEGLRGAWACWKGSLAEQCEFVVESVEKLISEDEGSRTSRSLMRVVASAARTTLDEARRSEAPPSPPPSMPRVSGPQAQSCSAAGTMTLRLVLYGGDKTISTIGSRLSEAGNVATTIASATLSGLAWQRNMKRLAGLEQVRAALEHLSMFVARAARLHPCAEDRLSEPDFRDGCRRTLEFAVSLIFTLLTDPFVRKHPLTLAPGRLRARADAGTYEHGETVPGAGAPPPMADVVLLPGIEGDVLHTFTSRFREFWPTAILAPDLGPSVRIVALQPPPCPFSALSAGASRGELEDRARKLLLRLEVAGVGARPFVIFSYSFGGVLAKAMYVVAAEDDRFRRFFKCLQGIVFASVPHAPGDLPRLVGYITRGCPAAQRAVEHAAPLFAEGPPSPRSPPRPGPAPSRPRPAAPGVPSSPSPRPIRLLSLGDTPPSAPESPPLPPSAAALAPSVARSVLIPGLEDDEYPSPPSPGALRGAAGSPLPPSPRTPSPEPAATPRLAPASSAGARRGRPALATLQEDFVGAIASRPEKPFETLCLRAVRAPPGLDRPLCGDGFVAPFNVNSAIDEEHLGVCRITARASPAYAHLLTFVRETLGVSSEPDALYSSPSKGPHPPRASSGPAPRPDLLS
eukprot:tig00000042_g15502.t1